MWSVAQIECVGQLMHHRAQVCAKTGSPRASVVGKDRNLVSMKKVYS